MTNPANVFFRIVKRLSESIALYPVLIASAYVLVAALVLAFESTRIAETLRDDLPPGLIDADNSAKSSGR
ncbi:hypothetical protein [Stutzerimonas sp. VN223-3]|uniref:hypothetical protein n=1 Tax=Stutzerimonas sp. VN223-3 TaxID=3384601 RepID=UPI0038B61A61